MINLMVRRTKKIKKDWRRNKFPKIKICLGSFWILVCANSNKVNNKINSVTITMMG